MAANIKQYLRKWSMMLNGEPFIDSRDGHQLRVVFDIEVSPQNSFMKAEIRLYNLSKATTIGQRSDIIFSAGYQDNFDILFTGTVTNVMKSRRGPDVITHLFCRGGTSKTRGLMNGAYGANAHVLDALKDAARSWPLALEVDEAQFDDKDVLPAGWTADKDIPKSLDALAGMFNFTWKEERGALVITRINKERTTPIFDVNQHTGMVGMPELIGIGEGIGVEVTCRINPAITTSDRINVQSEYTTYQTSNLHVGEMAGDASASGVYNVFSIHYMGDSHGDVWDMRMLGFRAGSEAPLPINAGGGLVWGSRVSQEFRAKVREIASNLNIDPNWLMAVMAFETGEAFKSYSRNPRSGATGLIQFIESTARDLGTSTAELARMSEIEQLDWVEKYFNQYRNRIRNIDDAYMAVFWPAAIGRPGSFVLIDQTTRPNAYHQNRELDRNQDGKITKDEAAERVRRMYKIGQAHMA